MPRKLHFAVVAVDGSITSSVYGPVELVQGCAKLQAHIPELDPCEIGTEVLSPDGRPFLGSSGYRMPVDGGLKDMPPSSVIFLDLDAVVVEDERVFSVGGGVCGLDTAVLTVIERFLGREIARICTKLLVLESRRPSELRYEARKPAVHNDPLVDKAVALIRRNLGARVTVDDLLQHLPTSRRTLNRRFKLETGENIQAFIQRLRIDRAKLLLETSSLPIERMSITSAIATRAPSRGSSSATRSSRRSCSYGSPRLA